MHVICFVWLLGWRLVCALEWFLGCRWWFIAYASQRRPKSVRPTELRRDLSGATPLAARRDSGALSLSMAATLGRVKDGLFRAGGALDGRRCSTHPNEQAPTLVRESSMYRATRQGWGPPRPATIMATASALSRPLTATVAPVKTWLPLNVTIDANDRGDTPSSYRARELGTGHQEMSRGTS